MGKKRGIINLKKKLKRAENAYVNSESGSIKEENALNKMDVLNEKLVNIREDDKPWR